MYENHKSYFYNGKFQHLAKRWYSIEWKQFLKDIEKYNKILWILLVILNIFDLILTYLGVTYYKIFGEANCYWKESIEAGNYTGIIIHKTFFLIILWALIMYKRGKQHKLYSIIIFLWILMTAGIYSFSFFKWVFMFWYYMFWK